MKSTLILSSSIIISSVIASYSYVNLNRYEYENYGAIYYDNWTHSVCIVNDKSDFGDALERGDSTNVAHNCLPIITNN